MESTASVVGLGPVVQFDSEVFEQVQQSGGQREVLACKFCHEIFPYFVREIDEHKDRCVAYAKAHNLPLIPEDIDVATDPAVLEAIAKEKQRLGYDDSMEVDFEVIGGDVEATP